MLFIQLGLELSLGLELRVGLVLRLGLELRVGFRNALTRSGVCRVSQLLQRADLKPLLGFCLAFSQGPIKVLSELD